MFSEVSTRDKVVFAIAGNVLFYRLVTLLCKAYHVHWHTKWCELCVTVAWLRQQPPQADADSQLGDFVRDKMDTWELQNVRKAIKLTSMSFTCISLLHLTMIITGTVRGNNLALDIVFYTLYVGILLPDKWPWLITSRSIHWLYLFVLAVSLVTIAWCPPQLLWVIGGYVKLLVACFSISRLQVKEIAVYNSLVALTDIICFYLGRPDMGHAEIRGIIVVDIAWIMLLVAFVWILRQSVQASFLNYFEAKVLQSEQSAVKGLLRMVCDVVIELNSQLCVVGPTQDLCTFLLRGASRALEGIPFIDLLQKEEDKAHLHEVCTSRPDAHAIHVSMRDGNDTFIEVEIFFSAFEGLDGTTRYLAGLREFTDTSPPVGQLPGWTSEAAYIAAPQAVIVDTFDQCRILQVSDGLKCLTGAGQGTPFVKYVQDCVDFSSWIQQQMNARMNEAMDSGSCSESESTENSVPANLEIELLPSSGWTHSHFSAVCTLQSPDSNDILDNVGLEPSHVRIKICDIVRQPGGFKRRLLQSRLPHNSPPSCQSGCFSSSTEDDKSSSCQNGMPEVAVLHARQMSL